MAANGTTTTIIVAPLAKQVLPPSPNHLIENHKSRDGFESFYEYDLDFWLDRMDNFKQLDHIELNSILSFICENEGFILENELYNSNFDYIGLYASNFEQLTNE